MRLDDVKVELGDKIQIEWKAFMLRPTEQGSKSREEFIEYTKLWSRMSETDSRLEVTSPWGSDDPHPSHSLPALAGSKLAQTYGAEIEDEFHDRMFKAYFKQNRTISDQSVIVAVAAESGIDATDFEEKLIAQQDELNAQVIADHTAASQRGVSAVPTVVVNDEVAIPGAQDLETYLRVFNDMLDGG